MYKSRPIQYLGLALLIAAALAIIFYPTGPAPKKQQFETRLIAPQAWQTLAPKDKSVAEAADEAFLKEFKNSPVPTGSLTVQASEQGGDTSQSKVAVIEDSATTQEQAQLRRERIVKSLNTVFKGVKVAPTSTDLEYFPPQPLFTLGDFSVFPPRRENGEIVPAVKLGLDLRGGVSLVLQVRRALFTYEFEPAIGGDIDARYQFTSRVRQALESSPQAELFNDVNVNLAAGGTNTLEVRTQAANAQEFQAQRTAIEAALKSVSGTTFKLAREPQFFNPEAEANADTGDGQTVDMTNLLDRTVEIIRARVDKLGVSEPQIQKQPPNRILVQLPGVNDPQRAIDVVGQTAQMSIVLLPQDLRPQPDPADPNNTLFIDTKTNEIVPNSVVKQRSQLLVTGDDVKPTSSGVLLPGGEPAVTFELQGQGRSRFGEATQKYNRQLTGQDYFMPIFLDERAISAPTINEPIPGGTGQISGGFANIEEARSLALLLNSGALPAPVDVVENRTISPTLGTDSLVKSLRAGLFGLIAVLIFMIVFYRLPGLMANFAVIIYTILNLAFFNLVGGTLTLPGIAGFLLALAMSFDTNILIFERLKEELAIQPNFPTALRAAFGRAWTAILDSHVTTLIAATVLFYFGTGPVKGFALTLGIGVLLSLFTAISVTRLFLWSVARWGASNPNLFARLHPQDKTLAQT